MEDYDEVVILCRDQQGEKISNVVVGTLFGPPICNILRGELAIRIPEKPRKDGQPHNYQTVYTDQQATFYDNNENSAVAPLLDKQHLLLASVKSNEARYRLFVAGQLDWGSNLKINDPVQVSLGHSQATAVIQYVGPVKGLQGITFGVEIVDPHYFGQGTTDGTFHGQRYFTCNDGNGMFVSLDKLSQLPTGSHVPEASLRPHGQQPATRARKQEEKKREKNEAYRFKVGDRVVAFKGDGTPVRGTVKWVGTYELLDQKNKPFSVAAVGIETDVKVVGSDMESCLPTKSHLFTPGRKKRSLFMREEEVMLESDFGTDNPQQPPATSDQPPHQPPRQHRQGQDRHRPTPYNSPPQQAVHQPNTKHPPPSHHSAGQHVAYAGRPDAGHSGGPPDPSLSAGLDVGSPVQLVGDHSRTGVIRWTGTIPELKGYYVAGVELDGPMQGCGDGVWRGHRYFACLPGRGFFCPITSLLPDPRVPQASQVGGASTGNPHMPQLIEQEEIRQQLASSAIQEQRLQEQLRQNQQQIDQLQLQLQQEKQSSQKLQEQLQQERQNSQDVQQSNQRLQEHLQQEQQSSRDLRQQLQQEQQIFQEQLQQEQQRSRSLQERLDRSPREIERMHPVTAVLMNVGFCTAQRSEVRTEAIIGEGAWGKVERGVFRGSKVAVKSIHPAILEHDTMQRLRREITIVAQVRHPNLVHFIAAVLDDTAQAPPMIITELLDINLRKAYEQKVVVPSHHLSILRDIAYGLHHLHSLQQPIIHRDISSPNVLLQQQPNGGWLAKVSDFGSANFAKDARTAGEGAIIYSAPETFPATVSDLDSDPPLLTTKVDVYSYGVVACELVTGKMPSSERYRAMVQEVQRKWVFMHELITRCTKRDPLHRPTMAEILDELPRPRPVPRPRK